MAARRTCNYVGDNCTAPAGYRVGGSGLAAGTESAKRTCYICGEPVCDACSRLTAWHGKRVRAGFCCIAPERVTVWRLETAQGKGPYRIPRPSQWSFAGRKPDILPTYIDIETRARYGDTPTPDPHPAPFEDGLRQGDSPYAPCMDVDEYCGFGSIDDLVAWFFVAPHDPEALENMGLLVTTWEIEEHHIRRGGKQLVFRRHLATPIESIPPTYFADRLPR